MEERLRGAEFADSVERQIAGAVQGVGEWWQDASADQEGWGDDALRLLAGGAKNVAKGWQDASADQEGIFDDLLRLTEGGVKNTVRVLDAGSFYGGKVGGQFAKMIGWDPRIGGAIGNVAGEIAYGFGAKALFKGGAKLAAKAGTTVDNYRYALGYGMGGTGGASVGIGSNIKYSSGLSPGVKNYISQGTVDMQAGFNWIREGGELDDKLQDILRIGRSKKNASYMTYEELYAQSKKSIAAKNKLDKYNSLIATGPALDADDFLHYGFGTENAQAVTALMAKDPRYSPQIFKSMEFHHKGMKAIQAEIHKRARVLRAAGEATDDDILNLHAMMNAFGTPSGSRISAGKWMHRLPHDVLHKQIMLKEGIQPSAIPWAKGPVRKVPKGFLEGSAKGTPSRIFKELKKYDPTLSSFDLEYIDNWFRFNGQGPGDLQGAIAKWKAFKKNKKVYNMYSPDGLSEIDRMVKKMSTMSIAELTDYQLEIIQDVVLPMTKEADFLEDFATGRYTASELFDLQYNKQSSKFLKEANEQREKLRDIDEALISIGRKPKYNVPIYDD